MSFINTFLQNLAKNKPGNGLKTNKQSIPSKLIESLQSHDVFTQNGAATHSTSNNNLVDLFFLAGAAREISEPDIIKLLEKSFAQDQLLTLKLIFWAGDIRAGAGERRFFRLAIKWLETHYPEILIKNIIAGNVEFFNRWDSLFELVENPKVKEFVLSQIQNGLENQDVLLAKWLPRKEQYGNFKKSVLRKLKINDQQYRKLIVHLSKTVEQQMSFKKWDQIEYSKVPSQAFNKYREAFKKHDESRFSQFIDLALNGEVKINAGAIFPHQLYQAYNQNKDEDSIIAQWNNLPDYLVNSQEKILPICDVSGSMVGLAMDVCVSLGIYISERNKGIFENAFITFSQTPKLQYLSGNLTQRIRQLETADWAANTDLFAVFEILLKKAVSDKIEPDQMPSMLLILSDMEFDDAVSGRTNLDSIRTKYAQSGYNLPKIVFWNLKGALNNSPAKEKDQNIALVSGFSPSILDTILSGQIEKFTPLNVVLKTLNKERYERVVV